MLQIACHHLFIVPSFHFSGHPNTLFQDLPISCLSGLDGVQFFLYIYTLFICIFMYTYIHIVYVYMCTYIHTVYICIFIYISTHLNINIYIYILSNFADRSPYDICPTILFLPGFFLGWTGPLNLRNLFSARSLLFEPCEARGGEKRKIVRADVTNEQSMLDQVKPYGGLPAQTNIFYALLGW